jgi:hypothetical protein
MSNNKYNGRINIMGESKSALQFQDKIHVGDNSFNGAVRGIQYDTLLSKAYFSHENIKIIQNGIRAGVHKMSNGTYIIGNQDIDSLKMIMRSIFLQNSTNSSSNIKEQIMYLNNLVLEYAIPQVYGEAKGYLKYKEDISTLPNPIARPVMTDNNNKQLELKPWF